MKAGGLLANASAERGLPILERPRLSSVYQRWLRQAVSLEQRLPDFVFSRWCQILIDASLTLVSIFGAYQLRFEFAVPQDARFTMYLWMCLLPVIGPALMWSVGVYRTTWRYFSFRDALQLGKGILLGTGLLLIIRLTLYSLPAFANPLSVILIQATLLLPLATGARALRRLLAEAALSRPGGCRRLLLVASDVILPSALHQISHDPDLEVAGLVVPAAIKLKGVRICGCPVLGDPSDLDRLLQQHKTDLIMIADAGLDCIGDVVSVATQFGVEVRLLPSAVDVMHGHVAVSLPRRISNHVERVLVVGGAGYLGSVLVPILLERGYKVRVLDRLLFGDEPLASVKNHERFELMVGDVRDIESVVAALRDCDAVIDLAALVGDPACAVNKQLSLEINRAATRMLIEVCKGYGISRFVFASTCSVYGASDYLVDERTIPCPISVYAETKVASEELVLEAVTGSFHPVILRLGTLFGLSPRPRFDLVINLLTARAATCGKITIYNGQQWRPFLHVHDAARAFVTSLEASSKLVSGEIFNVGDYRLNLQLSAVSQKVAEVVCALEIDNVDNTDQRNYRVSFDKIHSYLEFSCEKTVEFGIREIFKVIQSHQIGDFTASRFNNHLVTEAFAASSTSAESSMRTLAKLAA